MLRIDFVVVVARTPASSLASVWAQPRRP